MPFPKSTRRTAWETFVSVLKADPILQREVNTWRIWGGDPKDAEDFSSGQEPYLKLTPRSDSTSFADTQSIRADILVDVEAVITGSSIADGMDFHEAIVRALYPFDKTARQAVDTRLKAVGIRAVEPLLGAWAIENKGGQVLQANGTIRLVFYTVLKPIS